MLHFEGDKDFARAPADVWARLTDARFLVQCIPGVESVARAEADAAEWTLRPGVSFVRGTLDVSLRVVEAVPDTSARLLVHSKGIGSTSDVEAGLTFAPQDGGTRVHWSVEVKNLGGLLKAVPQGLIKASAQKVIADAWTAVEAQLSQSK
jgi:carbon monoxide dehydrogenase subunit G